MKTLVFDLDGTMYRGTQIIESAHQFLDYCIQKDIPFIFLTTLIYFLSVSSVINAISTNITFFEKSN